MYAVIGGIGLDPEQPGYKHIIMSPRSGCGLTYATAELDSMYGKIRSAWSQENGRFDWEVTVPANTIATVYVPASDVSLVTENNQPLESANGVTFLRMETGDAVLRLVSGIYHFRAN